jgi:MinD superfamily P-loop ATPase
MIPEINVSKCNGCDICVKSCPVGVIGLTNGKASVLRMLCEEYGICAFVCPQMAIVNELPDGVVGTGQTSYVSRR